MSTSRFSRMWESMVSPFHLDALSTFYNAPSVHTKQQPVHSATVESIRPITTSADLFQLTIDLQNTLLTRDYVTPGQFVRLAVPGSSKSLLAIIASPPNPNSTKFDFILSSKSDVSRLCRVKPGQAIAISKVMGDGVQLNMARGSHLHIFVDFAQGFAAARALIESPVFRSSTGEGCNRTSMTTIYCTVPTYRSIPYINKFSNWIVHGVSVIPIVAKSIVEHVGCTNLGDRKQLANDLSFACVAEEDTYNDLSVALMLSGFRKLAIHKLTSSDISDDSFRENIHTNDQSSRPSSFPESAYNEHARSNFEREVWGNWVHVREEMRSEFEKKWAAEKRVGNYEKAREREKANSWSAWAATNKDQWEHVQWDNISWGNYWKSWNDERRKWEGEGASASYAERTWSQKNSQEYWDWVQNGATAGRSAANNQQSTGYSGYQETGYSGSNASKGWNADGWSGYQKRGYKYEYEDPNKEAQRSYQKGNNGNQSGSTGSGSKGWNDASSQWGSKSKYQKSYHNPVKQVYEIDFYTLLGIDARASKAEIKKAYRKKAMQHHPDHNPGKIEESNTKMKQIVVAWTILKDDNKRKRYDSFGSAAA